MGLGCQESTWRSMGDPFPRVEGSGFRVYGLRVNDEPSMSGKGF